ncbi:hypothetical protein [Paraburkholderia phenoliruptrix]|nr:hypothetical protein [Paraburkholderia phenoliruptrix]
MEIVSRVSLYRRQPLKNADKPISPNNGRAVLHQGIQPHEPQKTPVA